MADWNLPTPTSNYISFVAEINSKFNDTAVMFGYGGPINFPVGTIRLNKTLNLFDEWDGSNFIPRFISIAGGGTGSTTAAGARTNLGLGSMAVQNSNAVNITGGSITGISFDIGSVTTGVLPLARGGTGSSLALAIYGEVLLSNGSQVVFASGQAINSLNASALTQGTVPQARLYNVGFLDGANNWTGLNSYNGTINIFGAYPAFLMINSVGIAGQKRILFFNYFGGFYIQFQNDDGSFAANPFYITQDSRVYCYGGEITSLHGPNITTGIINPARLGTGPANSSTYLRGDGVWATIATGGEVSPIPSGMIAIFNGGCPAGWSRFVQLDNRFPLGSSGAGATGGSDTHSHTFDVNSGSDGNHDHSFGGSFSGSGSGSGSGNFGGNTGGPSQTSGVDAGNSFGAAQDAHTHGFAVAVNLNVNVTTTTNIDGRTGAGGQHAHRVAGGTNAASHVPFYYTVVYCMKN